MGKNSNKHDSTNDVYSSEDNWGSHQNNRTDWNKDISDSSDELVYSSHSFVGNVYCQ